MFIAALFTIVKIWEKRRCLSIDEWIKTTWCIYKTEHHSAMKYKETLPFATTWMDLEGIMLSKKSQTKKKQIQCDFTYVWKLKKPHKTNQPTNQTDRQINKTTQNRNRLRYGEQIYGCQSRGGCGIGERSGGK